MARTRFTPTIYPPNARVVITGAGILTSMGHGWRENADGFRAGRPAFRPVTLFDTSRQRVGMAGEVSLPSKLPSHSLGSRAMARLDRASILLIHAGAEAWSLAGWDDGVRSEPIPLCLGTSAGAMRLGEDYFRQAVGSPNRRAGQASRLLNYQTHHQAMNLAEALDFSGSITVIANACASGANAIGHAASLIRRGECRRAIAGGYDALSLLVFAGFDSLQALAPQVPPRPFDTDRDGLALGEGAAMLTLESLDAARERGADILAEIVGYGTATDTHHLTQPHPEGDAALRSMEAACHEAGVRPEDIDYLNSHGTGTPLNDIAEGRAIQRWAGGDVGKIRVSSTKASIGHLLGGAGAVETVISLMALREHFLPPTTSVETPDPVCTFDLVREPREAPVRRVLTNSFGFGGANATLILEAFEEGRRVTAGKTFRSTSPVVRGWGAVSPSGWGAGSLLAAIADSSGVPEPVTQSREGRSGTLRVRRVPDPVERLPFLRDPRLRRVSPIARFAVAAALEAIGEERAEAIRSGGWRLGVVYCVVNGCVNYTGRFFGEVVADPSLASPIVFPETVYNAPASHLSALLGSHAPNYTLVGDSAQFADGLGIASRWLEADECDGVVVIGAEEFDWLSAEAFQLFTPEVTFAEGAGALYLERAREGESAVRLDRMEGPVRYSDRRGRKEEVVGRIASAIRNQQGMAGGLTLLDRRNGDARFDHAEELAWESFPGERHSPAIRLGEGGGAAVAWQCVAAAALANAGSGPMVVSAAGENEQAAGLVFSQG